MKRLALVLTLPVLAGCAWTDLPENDVIAFAAEPAYNRTVGGKVVAASCRGGATPRDKSFTDGLPGCRRDMAFAAQVAVPSHLTHPVTPGPAAAAPVAAAANGYLYGGAGAVAGDAATKTPGQVIVLPPAAAAAAVREEPTATGG